MRIRMHLPRVEPEEYDTPVVCPHDGCQGEHFKLHQRYCRRAVLDPDHDEVNVRRYCCLSCKRAFRVYPRGVSNAQRSDRLRGRRQVWQGAKPASIVMCKQQGRP